MAIKIRSRHQALALARPGNVADGTMAKIERTLDEKVVAINEIVKRLKTNLYDVIADDALLRRIHEHEDVIRTFNNTVEGHGFGVVQRSLISLFVLALMRCYDRQSDNRASLPHAIELLKDADVFEAVAVRARDWNPGMSLEDSNEKTAKEKITEAIAAYDRCNADGDFQARLTALRQHRDDYLAHSLFDMGKREKVVFGFLEDVMAETIPIVRALELAVAGNDWDPAQTRKAWDGYADAFWRRTLPTK